MSRVYTSSKTQVRVVMGEVTEIKEGGMDLVIKANQFNKATNAKDRKSTRLNSSHGAKSRMPSSA